MRVLQIRRRKRNGHEVVIAGKANPVAASGPGSMRCESEIAQLLAAGKYGEAYRLSVNNFNACGRDDRRVKKPYRPAQIAELIRSLKDATEHQG